MSADNEGPEFEGIYIDHWEVARLVVLTGKRLFGIPPRLENWHTLFPLDFELPEPDWENLRPGRYFRMRVRGELSPEGHFGHRGWCTHELTVSEVLYCDETDDPWPLC